ncbi:MAG: DUF2797 domain-containing protein [Candidatus Thorarchaeota archaeon]
MTLNWTVAGPRRCIGHWNPESGVVPCPERMVLVRGGPRCGPCNATDVSSRCAMCDGSSCHASPQRHRECTETLHVVYAALFGDEVVKVGVSSRERLMTRWLEQGADFAAEIAQIRGGMAARRMEQRLGRLAGLTLSVRNSVKVRLLSRRLDPDAAQSRLGDALRRAGVTREIIEREAEVVEWPPVVHDLGPAYGLPDMSLQRPFEIRSSVRPEGRVIDGSVEGMKGPLLITRRGSTTTISDLARLAGYTLITGIMVESDIQSDLTEFE